MWKPGFVRRIGGVIECVLKASDMNKPEHAVSGYAALTRPTGLTLEAIDDRNKIHQETEAL